LNEAEPKTFFQADSSLRIEFPIIASAIQLQPEEIKDDLNGGNCMTWDSLAKMAIAASLYDRFNIRIPTTEIFKLEFPASDRASHFQLYR
jgi:acyl carrier protein